MNTQPSITRREFDRAAAISTAATPDHWHARGYLGETAASRWTLWDNQEGTVDTTILGRGREEDIYPVLTKVLRKSSRFNRKTMTCLI
jgi:hypothetical protein